MRSNGKKPAGMPAVRKAEAFDLEGRRFNGAKSPALSAPHKLQGLNLSAAKSRRPAKLVAEISNG